MTDPRCIPHGALEGGEGKAEGRQGASRSRTWRTSASRREAGGHKEAGKPLKVFCSSTTPCSWLSDACLT